MAKQRQIEYGREMGPANKVLNKDLVNANTINAHFLKQKKEMKMSYSPNKAGGNVRQPTGSSKEQLESFHQTEPDKGIGIAVTQEDEHFASKK